MEPEGSSPHTQAIYKLIFTDFSEDIIGSIFSV